MKSLRDGTLTVSYEDVKNDTGCKGRMDYMIIPYAFCSSFFVKNIHLLRIRVQLFQALGGNH